MEELKKELTYPMAWGNSPITDFNEWRKAGRAKVLECMMAPPRRAESFDMKVIGEEKRNGYTARRIEFNINAYSRVVAYLLVPDGKGPFPAINALHDHGAHLYIGKEKMVRPFDVDSAVVKDADQWAANLYDGQYVGDYLAQHGYVVLSIDAPMWGERGRKEGVSREKYDIIAGNMMMLGRNLSAFMTYDDIASTDFLATLPEVDKNRIGCIGCSMGAYRAWMLSALSDKVKAGVAACWMVTTDVQLSTRYGRKEKDPGQRGSRVRGIAGFLRHHGRIVRDTDPLPAQTNREACLPAQSPRILRPFACPAGEDAGSRIPEQREPIPALGSRQHGNIDPSDKRLFETTSKTIVRWLIRQNR